MKNKHVRSNLDDFLEEEGLLVDTEATAIKRAITYQTEFKLKQAQSSPPITKSLRGVLKETKLEEEDYKKHLEEKHL
jgi:hypothetical protein